MTQTAKQRYAVLVAKIAGRLDAIAQEIADLPAPNEEFEIDWSHVGSLARVAELLDEAEFSVPFRSAD